MKKSAPKKPAKSAASSTKSKGKVEPKKPIKTIGSDVKKKKIDAKKQVVADKSITKTVVNAVGRLFSKSTDKEDAKIKTSAQPVKAAKAVKPGGKKKGAGKKGKEGFEIEEDDLLASDDEMGSEDIPDLSEFEETEEVEIEITEEVSETETVVLTENKPTNDDEIVLTDADGRRYCRVRDCDQISAVEGYCRYHYLLLWKKIQVRRKILVDGKLERYVEELTSRYPDKFLEMIKKDLRSEKDFLGAIAELEIDESANEAEFEDEAQNYIDEVRGMTTESGSISDDDEF